MAKWKAPSPRGKHRRRRRKKGRWPGYISSDVVEWTPEMKNMVNYCRRQLGLPLRITAAMVGVNPGTLYRKMRFWKKPTGKLKNYAPREVRDYYIEKYNVPFYTHAYRPWQKSEK